VQVTTETGDRDGVQDAAADDGSKSFNRAAQDVGNIVALEHVNVRIPDQRIATLFYIAGLGFTRDPYMMIDDSNMWVNMGQEQFHMPTGDPDVLRGHCGLVVPDLDSLVHRLLAVKPKLEGTGLPARWKTNVAPPRRGATPSALRPAPAVQEHLAGHGLRGIHRPARNGRRHRPLLPEIMGAPACVTAEPEGKAAHVRVGGRQELIFRETTSPSGLRRPPHRRLRHRLLRAHKKLKSGPPQRESNDVQYRFEVIIDPDSGEQIFEIEHEVRSFTHPMYLRPMVNRNAAQRGTYQGAATPSCQGWSSPARRG
jgi:hypothetical protein